jgi:hypothetical protein
MVFKMHKWRRTKLQQKQWPHRVASSHVTFEKLQPYQNVAINAAAQSFSKSSGLTEQQVATSLS